MLNFLGSKLEDRKQQETEIVLNIKNYFFVTENYYLNAVLASKH